MQSRSIDSYTHAIHSFQQFDSGSIDFTDPVEAARYDEDVEFIFPYFTKLACEACHVDDPAKYNVPDQSQNMPGVLSKAYTFQGRDRAIGAVPSYVTGPGQRACGSCHRSMAINHDDAGEIAALNGHWSANGYMVDNTTQPPAPAANWVFQVIEKIMAIF
jgi:hypothetical protein